MSIQHGADGESEAVRLLAALEAFDDSNQLNSAAEILAAMNITVGAAPAPVADTGCFKGRRPLSDVHH